MKARLVNEALKDVLKPRSKEDIFKEILNRLSAYKLPVKNIFQRAQHDFSIETKMLLNYIDQNYFKPSYLIPHNDKTKNLVHNFSSNFLTDPIDGLRGWNLYKFQDQNAIVAFSNMHAKEYLIFDDIFLKSFY